MAKYTMTINQILKSFTDGTGFKTKNDFLSGDYLSPDELIEITKDKFFSKMKLNKFINEDFKYKFLIRFYDHEIAYETVNPFFRNLQTILNNECFYLLKLSDELRNAEIDKLIENTNITNTSTRDDKNSNIGLVETTPQTDKSITFNINDINRDNFSLIHYADSIQEGMGKNLTNVESTTKGVSGGSNYNLLLQGIINFTEVYTQVFNILESRIFIQIY